MPVVEDGAPCSGGVSGGEGGVLVEQLGDGTAPEGVDVHDGNAWGCDGDCKIEQSAAPGPWDQPLSRR